MSIAMWGPSAWHMLHVVSFAFPDLPELSDQERAASFVYAFAHSIPCAECRSHFLRLISSSFTLHCLASRDAFSRAVVDWHNQVNIRLGKTVLSYEHVRKMYIPTSPRTSDTVFYMSNIRCIFIISVLTYLSLSFVQKGASRPIFKNGRA